MIKVLPLTRKLLQCVKCHLSEDEETVEQVVVHLKCGQDFTNNVSGNIQGRPPRCVDCASLFCDHFLNNLYGSLHLYVVMEVLILERLAKRDQTHKHPSSNSP